MIDHLEKGNTTYAKHCVEAIVGGGHLILTGLVSVVHGFFPFFFEKYVARTLITYYWRHFHYHPNPDVQEIVKKESDLALRRQKALYGIDGPEHYDAIATINAAINKKD